MRTTRVGRLSALAATAALVATGVPAASGSTSGPDGQTSSRDILRVSTVYGCTVTTSWKNAETAFKFFRGKGLTAKQSAGIVGNFIAESGADPKQKQCSGGPGRGIAQWEVGGRWDTASRDNMVWYKKAASQPSEWNLTPQLKFTWFELTEYSYYGLGKLKATGSVKGATKTFVENFERPSVVAIDKRYAAAQKIYFRMT